MEISGDIWIGAWVDHGAGFDIPEQRKIHICCQYLYLLNPFPFHNFIIYFVCNIDNVVTQSPDRQNVDISKKNVVASEVSWGAIVNNLFVLRCAPSGRGFQARKVCVDQYFTLREDVADTGMMHKRQSKSQARHSSGDKLMCSGINSGNFVSLKKKVYCLTLRLLMLYIYIYGAPILDVSRSHTTTHHSR